MRVSWPVLTARSWLTALLSLHLLVSVSAIKCLQCVSMQRPECETGDMPATQCAGPEDRYCVKYTGDSDQFVYRSCSSREMKDCETTNLYGRDMHVCFYTCYTDGCNAAMTVKSLPATILLVLAFACVAVSFAATGTLCSVLTTN